MKKMRYVSLAVLLCACLCQSGCLWMRNAPDIAPALPSTITIGLNQTYQYDLANHENGGPEKCLHPGELNWSVTSTDPELFTAEVNSAKQLVLTSKGQAGSGTITLTLTDQRGRSDSQTLQVIITDQTDPTEGEGEGEGEPNGMFELRGERVIYVKVGGEFIDPGVTAVDGYNGPLPVTIVSTVNTSVIGTYTVTYTATDSSGNTATLVRIVHVVDLTPPVITIQGDNPVTINIKVPYRDGGAIVTDNCGGMIDIDVVSTVNTAAFGTYSVTYTATDASGNSAQAIRTVIVGDNLAPQITILGSNPATTAINTSYTDAGATAIDNGDGDLTGLIQTVSTVDLTTLGSYTVTYTVTDSHGNTAQAVRTVNVQTIGIEIIEMPEFGVEGWIYGKVTGINPATHKVSLVIQYLELWYIKETLDNPSVYIDLDGNFAYWFISHPNDVNATAFYFTVLPIDAEPELCLPCFSRPEHPQAVTTLLVSRDPNARTLWFSGHVWDTKESGGIAVDPGPVRFSNSTDNVWVDELSDQLHLRLTYDGTNWNGVEVISQESPGYGTICFTTISQLDNFQIEPVFGAFLWDTTAPTVNFREIDMLEVAKWLQYLETNMQNVLQPCSECPSSSTHCHRFSVDTPDGQPELTHYLVWQPGYIECRTYFGAYSLTNLPPIEKLANVWIYTGTDVPEPGNEKMRFNIWLVNGQPPSDGQEVEVVISQCDWQTGVPVWSSDMTAPVINILGDNPATQEAMTPYTDAGATAIDDTDGDISASVTVENLVNVNLLGTYTVTYTATDSQGNTTTAVRMVNVVDTTPPVIEIIGGEDIDVPVEDPPGENFPMEILAAGYDWGISYHIGSYSLTSNADCAIELDSYDQVQILFHTDTGMVLVRNDQGRWVKNNAWPVVPYKSHCSMALTADDITYIATVAPGSGEKLICLNNKTGSWIAQTVNSLTSIGLENSIAITSTGNVVIGYWRWLSGAGTGYHYVSWNNGTDVWQTAPLGDSGRCSTNTLLDSLEAVHLIHGPMYTTNSSGSWVTAGLPNGVTNSSAKMDDADKIWIASRYGITNNASGSWTTENIFATILPGADTSYFVLDEDSLVIDSLGNLHLCFLQRSGYFDPIKWQAVMYASNLLGTWSVQVIDSWLFGSTDYRYMSPSLELDSQDMAHVVYYNLEDNKVRYATFDPYAVLGGAK